MIDQENDQSGIKNEQEERKELIECLALAYGITPGDSEGYYFNYGAFTQKEIASQLGYDNSTLGKMLKPDWIEARNRSYKPLIACLRKQIEINQLKSAGKKSGVNAWVAGAAAFLFVFSNSLWFLNNRQNPQPPKSTEKHIIESDGEFAALFSGEGGQEVADRLAEETYEMLKDIRDSVKAGRTLSYAKKKEVVFRFETLSRQIDGEVRNQMRGLNCVAVYKELNVVDIMDHITPRDSLFRCPPEAILFDSLPDCARHSNAHFDRGLWNMRELLFNPTLPKEDFKKEVIRMVRAIQQELSTEDMRVFTHFKNTGELMRPNYGNN